MPMNIEIRKFESSIWICLYLLSVFSFKLPGQTSSEMTVELVFSGIWSCDPHKAKTHWTYKSTAQQHTTETCPRAKIPGKYFYIRWKNGHGNWSSNTKSKRCHMPTGIPPIPFKISKKTTDQFVRISTPCYQYQTWTLSKDQHSTITACEMKCLKKTLNITRRDSQRNENVKH